MGNNGYGTCIFTFDLWLETMTIVSQQVVSLSTKN